MKPFHYLSVREAIQALNTDEDGLTAQYISASGNPCDNHLVEAEKEGLLKKFLRQISDTMSLVLIAAAIISAITAAVGGDSSGFVDVAIILVVILVNGILGVFQETKSENAVEALKSMTAAQCEVIRDGIRQSISADSLMVGDLVLLEAGGNVPADLRIIEACSLKINESALTGETTDVEKTAEALPEGNHEIPLADRVNMGYMGTTVTNGRGKGLVTAIGMDTEIGKIARTLNETEDNRTPLQNKLDELSKVLSLLVLGLCLFIFVFQIGLNLLRGGAITLPSVLESFMVAVSLAVAAIPEGLTTVVTLVLSIGVTRMSRRKAIVKKLSAVETLGCAGVICSDKTGTLTQNRMTVTECYGADEALLARAMTLCTDCTIAPDGSVQGEATEKALCEFAMKQGIRKAEAEKETPRVNEIPFDSDRKLMSTVHERADGSFIQYTKGAPDVVLSRCTHILKREGPVPIQDIHRNDMLRKNKAYADRALRVLAAAFRISENSDTPEESGLCLIGLCAMIDPVRPEVLPAIEQCTAAGIRPVMITGDHLDTARAIASELKILRPGDISMTGTELGALTDAELEEKIETCSVYARVQPEHKIRIVRAWQAKGKTVAMTGDGVNDAPAIKAADIGVGMGITGTDVTKQAADMILMDDNFATIVGAVEEGRKVYSNIRASIGFLLSSNLSEIVAILAATLMGFTLFRPVQLLWVNLITDSLPAIALGMEAAAPDNMKKKPRERSESVFADHLGTDILWQGLMIAALVLIARWIGSSDGTGTTMAFLVLSLSEVFHSFNLRSRDNSLLSLKTFNFYMLGAAALAILLSTAVTMIGPLASVFGFTVPGVGRLLTALLLSFAVIPITEAVKLLRRVPGKR